MLTAPSYQRQWLLVFGVTLATFVGTAVWLASRLPSFRDPSFDFYSMKRDEIFSVHGLTRRQEGSVKLGFAETYPAPEIGLYGNHIVGAFGADAFGRPQDAKFFFNYFYANLSLPEILSYLLQLEQRGHLPKQLILVQITPPNADNGQFIINLGNELPPDLLLRDIERDGRTKYLLKLGKAVWQTTNNRLHEILNYSTAILSIVQRGDYQDPSC